jgi:hypothetical protein
MPRGLSPNAALVAARYALVGELRGDAETLDWEGFDTALDRRVVVQLLRPELAHDSLATERFWQAARAAARRTAAGGDAVLNAGTDPETGQCFVVREWPASLIVAATGQRAARKQVRAGMLLRRFGGRSRWVGLGAGLILLVLAAALKPAVEGWLAWVNTTSVRPDRTFGLAPAVPAIGAQPGQTNSTPAPAPTVAPGARSAPPTTTEATPVPTRAPSATVVTNGQARKIVNTDGRGVALRAAPGGDRLPGKGYDEGVTVQALEQSGEWTHIKGSDGREGWVLSVTLAP